MRAKALSGAAPTAKRRTTLTIPAHSLAEAKRIARARHVNLSAVITEALSAGLRQHAEAERSEQIFSQYKRAFGIFSDGEMLLLDGVIMEPVNKR